MPARCQQTFPPIQTYGVLAGSIHFLHILMLSGEAPLTHLITDLLKDTGEELPYHQFPREVLVLGAVTRAQGLREVRLSLCSSSSSHPVFPLAGPRGLGRHTVRILVILRPLFFPDGQPEVQFRNRSHRGLGWVRHLPLPTPLPLCFLASHRSVAGWVCDRVVGNRGGCIQLGLCLLLGERSGRGLQQERLS